MTGVTAPTATEQAVYEMLTENTGTHMLDSGGAYGRNWEQNQGKTLEDFKNKPAAYLWEIHEEYFGVSLDLFHYLTQRIEFDAEMDAKFNEFVTERNEEYAPWLEEMELFADKMNSVNTEWKVLTGNSYNEENCLSQDIQYTVFAVEDEEWAQEIYYVLLQIHGGCDIRGGYTKPRVFKLGESVEDVWNFMGWNSYELFCDVDHGDSDGHYVSVMSGDVIDNQGTYTNPWNDREITETFEIDGEWKIRCPYCADGGTGMRVDPPFVDC